MKTKDKAAAEVGVGEWTKQITLMGSPTASGSLPSSSSVPQPQVCLPCPGPTPQPAARPSVHKALLEVATESLALVALDLSVLDSPALQEVVHLRGVDGSRPLLILGRGLANPVVDVIGQVAARLVDLGRGGCPMCLRSWAPTALSRLPALHGVPSHAAWAPDEPWVVAPALPLRQGASSFPFGPYSPPLGNN